MPKPGEAHNPKSRVKVFRTSDTNPLGRNNTGMLRRVVGSQPCPKCNKRMFADEVVDLGSVEVNGERVIGLHHRDDCTKEN